MPARSLLLSVLISVVFASNLAALSNSLQELLDEKGITLPANLEEKYPDADAVVILDEYEIDQSRIINPVYVSRHFIVKILKPSAIERYSTVKIPYYKEENVDDAEARTINDGTIIKVNGIQDRDFDIEGVDKELHYPLHLGNTLYAVRETEVNTNPNAGDLLKISKNDIYHKQGADAWKVIEINFPNVQVGSILEYYYKTEQKRVVLVDEFYFQHNVPVIRSAFKMANAKLLHFVFNTVNFNFKPETIFEPRFTNLDNLANNEIRQAMRTVDVTDQPENWQFYGHQYTEIKCDTLSAYPADIAFIPPFADVAPRIDVFMREAVNLWKKGALDFRIRKESFSPNWNYPVYRLFEFSEINERRSRKIKSEIADVIKDGKTPEEKVNLAVAWARKTIKNNHELDRWQSYFWGAESRDPDDVLQDGVANEAHIMTAIYTGLRLNDLMVYPAYARSRERGEFQKAFFSETQFDTPLLALETGRGKYKLWKLCYDMDVPADYISPNLEGVTALINTSEPESVTYKFFDVPYSAEADNSISLDAKMELTAGGDAAGSATIEFGGQNSAVLRKQYLNNNAAPDSWTKMLTGNYSGIDVQSETSRDDPAVVPEDGKYNIAASITLKSVAQNSAEGLLIKASPISDVYSSRLDGSERTHDVLFPYESDYSSSIELKIPAGYAMPDSLPEPAELRTRGLHYNRVVAKRDATTLLIKREFKVDISRIPSRTFNRRYADIYADIQRLDSETILIPKK